METKGEGLILKHPDGEYVLNGRNKDWIKVRRNTPHPWDLQLTFHPKVKPEYMVGATCPWWIGATIDRMQDNMGETVDVIVLGEGSEKSSIRIRPNIRCRRRIWQWKTWWRCIHSTRRGIG